MLDQTKKQTGNLGEKLAKNFLQKRNHKILTSNFYIKGGEIDLVALDKKTQEIVFIEVKTRSLSQNTWPEWAVGSVKNYRIWRAAQRYLQKIQATLTQNYRFDIIAIELDNITREAKITHFKYV